METVGALFVTWVFNGLPLMGLLSMAHLHFTQYRKWPLGRAKARRPEPLGRAKARRGRAKGRGLPPCLATV